MTREQVETVQGASRAERLEMWCYITALEMAPHVASADPAAAVLSGPGNGRPRAASSSRLLSIGEAAPVIGMSRSWIYEHAADLPFCRRVGRSLRFDEAGLRRWLENAPENGHG